MGNATDAPRGAQAGRRPRLWQRVKTRLRIMRLALMAEEVVEEVEAPPGRLGWDAVAGLLGEAMEGHSTRRLAIGPGAPIGREELAAALEAMGYPLTGQRVVLTLIHGYGERSTPSAPRGAIHEEHGGCVKTVAKEARVNTQKINGTKAGRRCYEL